MEVDQDIFSSLSSEEIDWSLRRLFTKSDNVYVLP